MCRAATARARVAGLPLPPAVMDFTDLKSTPSVSHMPAAQATGKADDSLVGKYGVGDDYAGPAGESVRGTVPDAAGGAGGGGGGGAAEGKGGEDDGGGSDDSDDEVVEFVYTRPVDERRPELGMEEVKEEWTVDHAKLAYMISRYARAARSASEKEGWIRQVPLLVIMYEGVTGQVFDFDYAPASTLVAVDGVSRRLWLNITQEGKAAVDDLREREILNGLKLSTEDFQPVTAYQVSLKGMEFVDQIPQNLKDEVDAFIHAPAPHPRELLQVTWLSTEELESRHVEPPAGDEEDGGGDSDDDDDIGGAFVLVAKECGYARLSSITESEDVSYVSSPYLPFCVRNPRGQKPFSSNAHRADESAQGTSNIRDELSEAIVLAEVNALVGEWIPFGTNQIVALNERLGALDRCQGGLFTAMVDDSPTDTHFQVPPGLTQVSILDFDLVRFINFEAEIHYPESEGIVQVENFGMHLNVDGTIFYGIRVEAILDRKSDSVSLDQLSRLLVDVHQDSSAIMNDLLSGYQRDMLDMIFMGDKDARGKFNMIISEGIEPFLPAKDYMDREDNENELKQVIGDLHNAYDVGDDGVLIVGRDGVLVAGANGKDYEVLLIAFLSLLNREMFIRNFFVRTFVLDDLLGKTRNLIVSYRDDPNHVSRIRVMLNNGSRDIVMLEELLSYLNESLQDFQLPAPPEEGTDPTGEMLHKLLNVKGAKNDVRLRVMDLMKLVHGAKNELGNLQQMTDVINTKQLEDVFKNVDSNTKYLVDASAAAERSSASLEVMQVILAGSFAFDIVDRLSGGSLNITVPDWVNVILVDGIVAHPGLWWILNMAWLLLVSVMLTKLMRYLGQLADGILTMRVKANRRVKIDKLDEFLSTRDVEVSDSVADRVMETRKTSWTETDIERWKGEPPKIEIQLDRTHGFLLLVLFQVNMRRTDASEEDLVDIFYALLLENGVLDVEREIADAKKFGRMTADSAKKKQPAAE